MAGDVAELRTGGVRTKPLREVSNVRDLLRNDAAQAQLQAVAASHMRPERVMKLLAALRATPKLGECKPMSLLGAMMTTTSLGLEPNTPLGHAYLIPFGNDVQLVIGYKGYVDLARRSGHVVSIHADVVYDDDEAWSYEYGSNQHLRHKPGPREGRKTHAYCYAKLTDGEAFVVLPWADIIKTRNASQGYKLMGKKSPWVTHEDAMVAKTAVRRLSKMLPLSIEMARATEIDEQRANYTDIALTPTESGDLDVEIKGDAEDAQTVEPDVIDPTPAEPEATPEPEPKPEPVAEAKPEPEPAKTKPTASKGRGRASKASAAAKYDQSPLDVTPEPEKAEPAATVESVDPDTGEVTEAAVSESDLKWARTFINLIQGDLAACAEHPDPQAAFDEFREDHGANLERLQGISEDLREDAQANIDTFKAEHLKGEGA